MHRPVVELDLSFVDRTVDDLGRGREVVIPILQAIQEHFRYLPQEALGRVCELTEITPAAITGVSTFYTQFRHRPVGRHMISVCHGTACHVKGSGLIQDALQRRLAIPDGDDTDSDGLFTVQKIACLGCCTLAPVIQIDDATYGRLTPAMVPDVLADFLEKADAGAAKPQPEAARPTGELGEIRIGLGSCCVAQGSGHVHEAIGAVLAETQAPAVVKRVGCVGMCHQTPLVEIVPPKGPSHLFAKMNVDDVRPVVLQHFKPKGVLRQLGHKTARLLDRLLTDEIGDPLQRHAIDVRDGPVCAFLGR
ncbi:MAG: NAD(P)H-dependent oxidoreductase subunit E, partial [Planctomycetes bacterium]|nr:NAD(P)H-dependent oxidoreductase subunit E [Planctomycetota bacterium]